MILDQIAWIDCFVFLALLAPQLLIQVGLIETVICSLKALPHLLFVLPYQLIKERYFTPKHQRSPFVQQATLFQDVVIRCVRYAFAFIPAKIGKVFFSKNVALPFMRFRMLRHGIWKCPIYWREVNRKGLKGVFIIDDETRRPDVVVYYCHGGGFSMGSAYFYLEFLLAWVALLKTAGYSNPAVFALEYTLVPEATYPIQVQETLAGYKYCLHIVNDDPSRICVSGDSAGATLILSLLLCLSDFAGMRHKIPAIAIPISAWAAIISPSNKNTPSDYLNEASLQLYGSQYIGARASPTDPLVSPGQCRDLSWWRRASPSRGWFFVWGTEEVFAPDAAEMAALLRKAGAQVEVLAEPAWIHAWPVVKLFLCNSQKERLSGLTPMVKFIRGRIEPRDS